MFSKNRFIFIRFERQDKYIKHKIILKIEQGGIGNGKRKYIIKNIINKLRLGSNQYIGNLFRVKYIVV